MDALAAAAQELVIPANRLRFLTRPGRAVLRPLVRAVCAVGIPVAGPELRHTHRVIALERARAAGGDGTERFIAAVVTVGILVADERLRHALTAAAAELIVRAVLQD